MSTAALHAEHDAHHHHKESFISKYVFSMDHKMISKQFLITGIVMGILGMGMSLLFRLQLAWPDEQFSILETLLGKWGAGGKLDPNYYMGLVTIHGTIMVFYVLTAGLSGTFSNLLIPLQLGARDMVLLGFFHCALHEHVCRNWTSICRLDCISSIECA
jgi:cytochrome c oxidase subunit 1